MKLTKWEHACMVLELEGSKLVLDPGAFTAPVEGLTDVIGIVVTHEHFDHWTPEQFERILRLNPSARVFGTDATVAQAREQGVTHTIEAVHPGDQLELGPFRLRFFGGDHAIIHESIPQIRNVGVLVNDTLYYPGDSFFVPDVHVPVLAAPASAPWLKIAETMDFIMAVRPERCIQSHEMANSVIGNGMAKARMAWATEQGGGAFTWLEPGDTYEL
ncbi:MAG: MBL fold metallo-hydrolase [Agromyces sp.]